MELKMQHQKVTLSIVLLLGVGLTKLDAQEATTAGGGNASGSGGSVSYSVGQIVYTTNSGTNGSVAQGVQQPFEISVVTAINEAAEINLMVSTYPNPVTDFLTLNVNHFEKADLSYQLFDTQGKLLATKKIENNETCIVMSNLASASYFLKIRKEKKEIKVFKIIKN